MWTTPIFTRGGFEWETIRVPFYHMFQQFQDTKARDQNFLAVEGIWDLRFRIQDDIAGPFKLEIDYIAVAHDFAFQTFDNSRKFGNDFRLRFYIFVLYCNRVRNR